MFYVHSRDYVSDFDKVYNDYFNFQRCLLCWKSNFFNIWFEKIYTRLNGLEFWGPRVHSQWVKEL